VKPTCRYAPDTVQWNNDSFFDGMELQVKQRISHGFKVQGSYTWSKALDEGGGGIASDSFLNSVSNLFYFLPKYRRAMSDFNVAQNLTINYVWNIAAPHSFSGPAAWAARGWQLGGIFQMRSGLPLTPVTGPSGGEYGEMRSLIVGGQRGAAVFIRPDVESLGQEIARRARRDMLLRDSIVYLTCLHELGHAPGLVRDIM